MFFPETCISSAHQHSRRKEYDTTICYVTNPGMPWCLQRSLRCSVSLFSFSDYGHGILKQYQWTRKAPLILEHLKWNGETVSRDIDKMPPLDTNLFCWVKLHQAFSIFQFCRMSVNSYRMCHSQGISTSNVF